MSKSNVDYANSLIATQKVNIDNYDYLDCFEYCINDPENKMTIFSFADAFMQPSPKWFDFFLALRDKLVSPFKLKTNDTIVDKNAKITWQPGTQAGLFRVFALGESEIVMGEDDKHLDFRVLLRLEDPNSKVKKVSLLTLVKYNNSFGRFYFFFVKPFHRLFVPLLLKRNFRKLEV